MKTLKEKYTSVGSMVCIFESVREFSYFVRVCESLFSVHTCKTVSVLL